MLVYRVASPKKDCGGIPVGPYATRSEAWESDMAWAHGDDDHPGPYRDGDLGDIRSYEFCAFESMDGLNAWFEGWLDKLNESGYLVHVYEVAEEYIRRGRVQILVNLAMGTLVRTEPCI
jgi:ribosome modulation factor